MNSELSFTEFTEFTETTTVDDHDGRPYKLSQATPLSPTLCSISHYTYI